MFDPASLAIFVAASLALLIIPGPAVLYIVARSLEQGRVAGVVSMLGVNFASVVHVVFAALGLSALIMSSAILFSVIKYLGAIYLIYIGIRTILSKTETARVQPVRTMRLGKVFTQGFIVNMLNPKTALFFLAFLPQFVDPARGSVVMQILLLGLIFIVLAVLSDGLYAMVAGTAKQMMSGNRLLTHAQKYLTGLIFIGLGVTTALTGNGQSE